MIGSLKRVLVIVLTMAIAIAFVPLGVQDKAYAEESIVKLSIDENGVLSWEILPNAEMCQIYIDGEMAEFYVDTTEYELQKLYPAKLEGTMPTIDELENTLNDLTTLSDDN